ncbi:MAG: CotH kinase family protein [Bacteroidaceae bacterium]|nr:CotH kinase family protein [Bacteroidaceae bacterium]
MEVHIFRKMCFGLALLGLTACTEKDFFGENGSEVTIKADIEAPINDATSAKPETRTFIDEDDAYASGVGTMWRANEVIGVYGSLSKNVKFTSTNDEDASSVSFKGFMFGTPKYAYYPYSETNNDVAATAVKLAMPIVHEYNSVYKDLVGDFRAGVLDSRSWFSSTFTFSRLVSILKFKVDATGTALEGSNIRSISIKVGNQRKISGDVTVNLESQALNVGEFAEGNDSLTLKWTNEPTLSNGMTRIAYATALPTIQTGDEMTVTIETTTHKATFIRTSKATFNANGLYGYTFTLADIDNLIVEEFPKEELPEVVPVSDLKIANFKFTVANNPGKILPGRVVFNSSSYKAELKNDVTEQVCEIDTVNHKISLYVPYLNNRKLVPTFELSEGASLIYEGGAIISGETEVDFATYKQVAVVNEAGEGTVYDVELTNTGLPVVVVNQETGTTSSESNSNYSKGSAAWYAATGTKWQPKDSDWAMTEGVDNFMVYNADGTSALTNKSGTILTEPILASTRVRGNITQRMPKKAFAVKLDSKSGVLGMKAHKRWVLLANWKDRTLMRNDVAFGIANVFKQTFPNDGMAWNPSGQFVELVYNGVHVGNYYLCEQIKIDGNRLDIKDPYDAEDSFTAAADYGYLLECDDAYDETWKFTSKHYIPFLFKDDGNDTMLQYAKDIVYGVEENLYKGYSGTADAFAEAYKTLDLTSVVDYWLIQELMLNSEMQHPKSTYMYINDGKLYAGPIWDFDWNTLPTSSLFECDGYSYTGSMLQHIIDGGSNGFFGMGAKGHFRKSSGYPDKPLEESDLNYMWYPMLVKDATFKAKAAERWNAVKGALSAYVASLPQLAAKIKQSESENWSMWQLDSNNNKKRTSMYSIGNVLSGSSAGYCGDEALGFEAAVEQLQDNLNTRINGMDYVSNQTWPNITIKSK